MLPTSSVLPLVLAAHFVGDWLVQTDWQAANKTRPTYRWDVRGDLPGPALGTHHVQTAEGWKSADRVYERSYWGSWEAMLSHMFSYHLTLAAALSLVYRDGQWWRPVTIILVSLVTHAFIDRRWPVRWLLVHTGSAAFAEATWGVLVADQALHLSILLLLVAVVVR